MANPKRACPRCGVMYERKSKRREFSLCGSCRASVSPREQDAIWLEKESETLVGSR